MLTHTTSTPCCCTRTVVRVGTCLLWSAKTVIGYPPESFFKFGTAAGLIYFLHNASAFLANAMKNHEEVNKG